MFGKAQTRVKHVTEIKEITFFVVHVDKFAYLVPVFFTALKHFHLRMTSTVSVAFKC